MKGITLVFHDHPTAERTEASPARAPSRGAGRAAAGDIDWLAAMVALPARKRAISIRLDEDVLEFFKSTGSGYQRRINAVYGTDAKARAPRLVPGFRCGNFKS